MLFSFEALFSQLYTKQLLLLLGRKFWTRKFWRISCNLPNSLRFSPSKILYCTVSVLYLKSRYFYGCLCDVPLPLAIQMYLMMQTSLLLLLKLYMMQLHLNSYRWCMGVSTLGGQFITVCSIYIARRILLCPAYGYQLFRGFNVHWHQ